jgi:hypothetical protein
MKIEQQHHSPTADASQCIHVAWPTDRHEVAIQSSPNFLSIEAAIRLRTYVVLPLPAAQSGQTRHQALHRSPFSQSYLGHHDDDVLTWENEWAAEKVPPRTPNLLMGNTADAALLYRIY